MFAFTIKRKLGSSKTADIFYTNAIIAKNLGNIIAFKDQNNILRSFNINFIEISINDFTPSDHSKKVSFNEGLELVKSNINMTTYEFLKFSTDKRSSLTLLLENKYDINLDWLYSLL